MLPAALQQPRSFLGLVALEGLVLALGGQDHSGALLDTVEVYGTAKQLADAGVCGVGGGQGGGVEGVGVRLGLGFRGRPLV
jgi:hypothetical protein